MYLVFANGKEFWFESKAAAKYFAMTSGGAMVQRKMGKKI